MRAMTDITDEELRISNQQIPRRIKDDNRIRTNSQIGEGLIDVGLSI